MMEDPIAQLADQLSQPLRKDPNDSAYERGREDPHTKKQRKAEAKSRRINRKISGKKRKISSHKRRK